MKNVTLLLRQVILMACLFCMFSTCMKEPGIPGGPGETEWLLSKATFTGELGDQTIDTFSYDSLGRLWLHTVIFLSDTFKPGWNGTRLDTFFYNAQQQNIEVHSLNTSKYSSSLTGINTITMRRGNGINRRPT